MNKEILKWVKIVVLKTVRDKRLTHLDIDTLISAGYEGYSQSLRRFDPNRGVKFKTFAEYRIKGAVLDEVRKMIGDERCKNKRPRQAYDYDISQIDDDNGLINNMDSQIDISNFFGAIPIDDRSREILVCRIEGMNLREIGDRFGFSESRASQLLADIKRTIYPWFEEYLGANFRLVEHRCPSCGYSNETAEFSQAFDCESCGSDIVIENGTPTIFTPEEEIDEGIAT